MPAGRPSKYEPEFCDQLLECMGQGFSLTAFAGEIGVARSTINEWIAAHPEFSEAVKIGQAKRTRKLEGTLLDGETGAKVTAHIFALKNADPEGWRDKQEIEHGGAVQISRIERTIVRPPNPDC
jgi:transposase